MRTAKKTKVDVSLQEAQEAAHRYAELSVQKDAQLAEMNEQIRSLREQYEPNISVIDEELTEHFDVLQSYAVATKDEWDKKSVELANCTIGFRSNPPSVAKKKGITWDAIVGLLKGKRNLKEFVKVKEEIDKKAILGSQSDAKLMKELTGIGIVIEQEEQFYVDPKKEEI